MEGAGNRKGGVGDRKREMRVGEGGESREGRRSIHGREKVCMQSFCVQSCVRSCA